LKNKIATDVVKNKYEILFIIKSGTTEATREKSIAKFEKLIEKAGGTIDLVDKWGNRRFSYPIDYKIDGFYVLIYFTGVASIPKELERVMLISDEVVRFMIINRNGLGEPIPKRKIVENNAITKKEEDNTIQDASFVQPTTEEVAGQEMQLEIENTIDKA